MFVTEKDGTRLFIPNDKVTALSQGRMLDGEIQGSVVWAGNFVYYVSNDFDMLWRELPPE